MAVIFIPLFSAWFLFMLWRIGLSVGVGKGIIGIFHLGVFSLAFLTVGIIVVIRLFLKRKVPMLTQVLILQLPFAPLYFTQIRNDLAFDFNLYLYQERRENFVQEMKSDSATFDQKPALVQAEKHRKSEFPVALADEDYNLVNVHPPDSGINNFTSNVSVQRTCDGELIVTFMMDNAFFGDSYAIMYSERLPEKSEYSRWDAEGGESKVVSYSIEEHEIEKVLSPNWYYVRIAQPGMFDGIFDGMFDGMFNSGGGGGVPATGGCN